MAAQTVIASQKERQPQPEGKVLARFRPLRERLAELNAEFQAIVELRGAGRITVEEEIAAVRRIMHETDLLMQEKLRLWQEAFPRRYGDQECATQARG